MLEDNPFAIYRDSNYRDPPKIIYTYEPYFEYKQQGLTDENVPNFAKAMFIDPFIKNHLKQKFIDTFLLKYVNDRQFRVKNKGKYIVIIDNSEYEIVNNEQESIALRNYQKGGKLNIYIGDLMKFNGGVSKVVFDRSEGFSKLKTSDGTTIDIYKQNHYKLKCGITHLPTLQNNCVAFDNNIECVYDTGCDISFLFLLNLWNFNKFKFNEIARNGTTEYWNDNNFKKIERIEFNIADNNITFVNLIELDNPLYISINGLNPVPIYTLIVPIIEPENHKSMMFLIGLDIINQHTSIISKFNNKVELRITNQKEEMFLS